MFEVKHTDCDRNNFPRRNYKRDNVLFEIFDHFVNENMSDKS